MVMYGCVCVEEVWLGSSGLCVCVCVHVCVCVWCVCCECVNASVDIDPYVKSSFLCQKRRCMSRDAFTYTTYVVATFYYHI